MVGLSDDTWGLFVDQWAICQHPKRTLSITFRHCVALSSGRLYPSVQPYRQQTTSLILYTYYNSRKGSSSIRIFGPGQSPCNLQEPPRGDHDLVLRLR